MKRRLPGAGTALQAGGSLLRRESKDIAQEDGGTLPRREAQDQALQGFPDFRARRLSDGFLGHQYLLPAAAFRVRDPLSINPEVGGHLEKVGLGISNAAVDLPHL